MKIGVIGCGKVGTALVQGAIRAGVIAAGDVTGCGPYRAARDAFTAATGARAGGHLTDCAEADVLLLCTKPHDVAAAIHSATAAGMTGKLIISIAAGVTLTTLDALCAGRFRVIRAMPNTPALVGKGAAGFCLGGTATAEDSQFTHKLLSAVGLALEVPERLMDAVTGLSGSGPAYVYLIIEALADGGLRMGLPKADALRLAAQTVFGAAAMVVESGTHPAVLKDAVTSPGGTTIAGLAAMEKRGVRSALIEAVGAATRRAAELGES
jgi:pyrroline-5-carboxylate reductase